MRYATAVIVYLFSQRKMLRKSLSTGAVLCALGTSNAAEIADLTTGCRAISPLRSEQNATAVMVWSGGCTNGLTSGRGTMTWNVNGAPGQTWDGTFASGKPVGRLVITYPAGWTFKRWIGDRDSTGTWIGPVKWLYPDGRQRVVVMNSERKWVEAEGADQVAVESAPAVTSHVSLSQAIESRVNGKGIVTEGYKKRSFAPKTEQYLSTVPPKNKFSEYRKYVFVRDAVWGKWQTQVRRVNGDGCFADLSSVHSIIVDSHSKVGYQQGSTKRFEVQPRYLDEIHWIGECRDGTAQGKGALVVRMDGHVVGSESYLASGVGVLEMRNGIPEGPLELDFEMLDYDTTTGNLGAIRQVRSELGYFENGALATNTLEARQRSEFESAEKDNPYMRFSRLVAPAVGRAIESALTSNGGDNDIQVELKVTCGIAAMDCVGSNVVLSGDGTFSPAFRGAASGRILSSSGTSVSGTYRYSASVRQSGVEKTCGGSVELASGKKYVIDLYFSDCKGSLRQQ